MDQQEFKKPYFDCKVGLPWFSETMGRWRISCTRLDGKIKTMNYARYCMEVHLGRYLSYDEVVHHKDLDKTNDELTNLEVKPRPKHSSDHNKKHPLSEFFECPICFTYFELFVEQIRQRESYKKQNPKYAGPYCSKKCALQEQ